MRFLINVVVSVFFAVAVVLQGGAALRYRQAAGSHVQDQVSSMQRQVCGPSHPL